MSARLVGGAYKHSGTVDMPYAYLCADIGDVLWQINNGDGGFHQRTVQQGELFNYSFRDPGETWLNYDVLQAAGNRFQFGGSAN